MSTVAIQYYVDLDPDQTLYHIHQRQYQSNLSRKHRLDDYPCSLTASEWLEDLEPQVPAKRLREDKDTTTAVKQEIKPVIAKTQNALLLHAAKQPYTLAADHAVPELLYEDEVLVKITNIGLNPVDWKGPAFNFGIPSLPWINGRDFAGTIVALSPSTLNTNTSKRRNPLKIGDRVSIPSTDYRDIRKAAFQEYAITTAQNAIRIPVAADGGACAALGVAFVAAAVGLGVSFGVKFGEGGPDLVKVLKGIEKENVPVDVRGEAFGFESGEGERAKKGDWVAIWGASTTTGLIALQLAKLSGLRVICIADIARHGSKLLSLGADVLVDRLDTDRAIDIIRGVTNNKLRFGIDLIGRDTAILLERALHTPSTASSESSERSSRQSHLLGLNGNPKEKKDGIKHHILAVKLFHEVKELGEELVVWAEKLIASGKLALPDVVRAEGGLGGINDALVLLKDGSVSGKRVVVDVDVQE